MLLLAMAGLAVVSAFLPPVPVGCVNVFGAFVPSSLSGDFSHE